MIDSTAVYCVACYRYELVLVERRALDWLNNLKTEHNLFNS